nr:MAG TPA: hypothetical protein [Caudoviricetes sp.]
MCCRASTKRRGPENLRPSLRGSANCQQFFSLTLPASFPARGLPACRTTPRRLPATSSFSRARFVRGRSRWKSRKP